MDIYKLKNPKNVKFNDLLNICIKYFGKPRIKGSHHIFKTPWKAPAVPVGPCAARGAQNHRKKPERKNTMKAGRTFRSGKKGNSMISGNTGAPDIGKIRTG